MGDFAKAFDHHKAYLRVVIGKILEGEQPGSVLGDFHAHLVTSCAGIKLHQTKEKPLLSKAQGDRRVTSCMKRLAWSEEDALSATDKRGYI